MASRFISCSRKSSLLPISPRRMQQLFQLRRVRLQPDQFFADIAAVGQQGGFLRQALRLDGQRRAAARASRSFSRFWKAPRGLASGSFPSAPPGRMMDAPLAHLGRRWPRLPARESCPAASSPLRWLRATAVSSRRIGFRRSRRPAASPECAAPRSGRACPAGCQLRVRLRGRLAATPRSSGRFRLEAPAADGAVEGARWTCRCPRATCALIALRMALSKAIELRRQVEMHVQAAMVDALDAQHAVSPSGEVCGGPARSRSCCGRS